MHRTLFRAMLVGGGALLLLAQASRAQIQPPNTAAQQKAFRHPDMYVPERQEKLSELSGTPAAQANRDLRGFGLDAGSAFYDSRVGRLVSLILKEPLIPGTGKGNALRWPGSGARPGEDVMKETTADALRDFIARHQGELRLDPSEFGTMRVTVFENGNLVYVYIPRIYQGVTVRNSSIGATLNHGNLVLFGLKNWGDIQAPTRASVADSQAAAVLAQHVAPMTPRFDTPGHLELLPMATDTDLYYRLVWVVPTRLDGDIGEWEGLVDANSGELIAFQDKNEYAQRTISGGVYPVSNDQRPPDGIEQTGWPMPYADVLINGATIYTDAGGNIGCATGAISTKLSGLFLQMLDNCGAINETSSGSIDLGSGPTAGATDCTTPGAGHSPGDTKSSRTGYFELTQLNRRAHGWLPANSWVNGQVTANMNLNQTCNAFWDGSAVNFFKSSSQCRNTGEIAAIFDHEWGHGLDQNGANPTISNPGEAPADMSAITRLDESCVGRGFFKNQVCGGYGDACNGTPADGCTGVRDVDFANHRCDLPHTVSWVTNGFTVAQCPSGAASACPGGGGPCGHEVHCEGYVPAETVWDLKARDFVAPPFNYDSNTALELTTRLYLLGSQPVGDWYTCSVGGGCGATGGYLNFLAADDDNGDITDGTPHMTAIRAAFERHEIHCATPAPLNSGCAGGPTEAPTVNVTPLDSSAIVSWNAISGASSYNVYRTDGVHACDFGKIKIGTTSEVTFTDSGLQNGRTYYYSVVPVGSNTSCFGPMSVCATATPVGGPNLGIQTGTQLSIVGGDGDPFLDNCETGTITFTVANTGTGGLSNIRIVAVTPLSHPSTVVTTPLPAAIAPSLDECSTAQGSFSFVPQGMAFGDTFTIQVDVTADELGGDNRSQVLTITNVETDGVLVPSRTYSFEVSLDGWTITSGTYSFMAPGANGTGFYLNSSSNIDNECDVIQSPEFVLTSTSTLSLYEKYVTENPSPTPFDRANVGIRDVSSDTRVTILPTSGRLYDIPPDTPNGTCVTASQAGWAGNKPSFAVTGWDSGAMNPGGVFTGRTVRLEVGYGTDAAVSGAGLGFDEVTLTNILELGPDQQSNTCVAQSVAPVSYVIDTAGNGVLDPNETALFSPTWANTGFQSIDLAGTLSNFTGPGDGAGATYSIPDGSGDYGTIGVGTQGTCANCYSLNIAALARPVQHWDVSVDETVGPATLKTSPSSVRTWNLHVGGSFTDVSPDPAQDPYYSSIETIYHNGVTVGCHTGTEFCPNDSTLRQEMAVFLLRASQGAGYAPPPCQGHFNDVPCPSTYADWIEDLSQRGITAGCQLDPGFNPPVYCPNANVLRGEMAVFLIKTSKGTAHVPPPCTGHFNDVPCPATPDFPYSDWIEELFNDGVTAGCQLDPGYDPPVFCPNANILRQEMAVFLTRTFGLVLYGP